MVRVDCLMGTYGRYSLACESLACFLQQSCLDQATLLIFNQHPVPLRFEHPRVRVVNELMEAVPLRLIRRRMLELADPSAEFIHFWEDDDLYLPWHLEDCLGKIGDALAWKPVRAWFSLDNNRFSLETNTFEGAWMFRADCARAAAVDTHPDYTDHPVYRQTVERGGLATTDLGARTSYIYRWANGYEHLSGYGGDIDDAAQRDRVTTWRSRSNDVRNDGKLVAADLRPRWRLYLDGTRPLVSRAEWALNSRRVGMEPWL